MIRFVLPWLWFAVTGTAPPAAVGAVPAKCAVIPVVEATGAIPPAPRSVRWGPHRAAPGAPHARVVRYAIDARLDPRTRTISGREALTWRNRSAATVCTLYLHLDPNAPASGESPAPATRRWGPAPPAIDAGGQARLTAVRQGGAPVVWMHAGTGAVAHRTVVRLDLPRPVAPGAATTLDIGFTARLPGAGSGGGGAGSLHLASRWFPRIATLELPGERGAAALRWNAPAPDGDDAAREPGDFDVRITVPAGYRVGAGGTRVGAVESRDGWTTQRFVLAGARDFAWVADARFAPPLDYVYRPVQGTPIRLRVLHRPGQARAAAAAVDAVADALGAYTRTLGAYPYRSITAVVVPHGATPFPQDALPALLILPADPRSAPELDARIEHAALRGVGAAYFDGIAGSRDVQARALARGLADYWSARLLRERRHAVATTGWWQWPGRSPLVDPFAGLRLQARLPQPPLDEGDTAARIALALHDLEARIGTPAIDRAFRAFLPQARAMPVDIHDLREALAHGSGRAGEVRRMFVQHIEHGAIVDDRIAVFRSDEALPKPGLVEHGGRLVELTQPAIDRAVREVRRAWQRRHRDARTAGRGPFPYRTLVVVQRRGATGPQTLRVTFADGSTRGARWDDPQALRRFEWLTPSRAVSVQLDPHQRVLLDRNKLDDGRALQADTAAARRWGSDVAAAVQIAAALVVGL